MMAWDAGRKAPVPASVLEEPIRLGISACLLGHSVRYDGGHRLDRYLADTLGRFVTWVPVCPEKECGLGVPREAMRLVDSGDRIRLITRRTGIDHTGRMLDWAEAKLGELEKEDLSGFVFKSRSPSSGMSNVKVYDSQGTLSGKKGVGLFACAFMKRFPLVPVEDDGRMNDPALRENFITRVFVFHRWKEFIRRKPSPEGLVSFHTGHKLLVMAHSPKHLTALGRLAAEAGPILVPEKLGQYLAVLMEALRLQATVKKNFNVLHHIVGYFKKFLTADEKKELLGIVEDYHAGLVPLVSPLTLLNHHVRKHGIDYLKGQHFLHPHPKELMLTNHV